MYTVVFSSPSNPQVHPNGRAELPTPPSVETNVYEIESLQVKRRSSSPSILAILMLTGFFGGLAFFGLPYLASQNVPSNVQTSKDMSEAVVIRAPQKNFNAFVRNGGQETVAKATISSRSKMPKACFLVSGIIILAIAAIIYFSTNVTDGRVLAAEIEVIENQDDFPSVEPTSIFLLAAYFFSIVVGGGLFIFRINSLSAANRNQVSVMDMKSEDGQDAPETEIVSLVKEQIVKFNSAIAAHTITEVDDQMNVSIYFDDKSVDVTIGRENDLFDLHKLIQDDKIADSFFLVPRAPNFLREISGEYDGFDLIRTDMDLIDLMTNDRLLALSTQLNTVMKVCGVE